MTTKDMAKVGGGIAMNKIAVEVTADDITKYFCPNATQKEVYMALGIIKSLQLNPFKREVHLVKYDDKSPISIVVGYEVYLKRADRTGNLDGWKYEYTGSAEGLACKVTIWRKDQSHPFEHVAYWSEVCAQKPVYEGGQRTNKWEPNRMWKSRPKFMLMKVAAAQAFRLAFPDEMGGLPYTEEEGDMITAAEESHEPPRPVIEPPRERVQPEANPEKESASPLANVAECVALGVGDKLQLLIGKVVSVESKETAKGKVKYQKVTVANGDAKVAVSVYNDSCPAYVKPDATVGIVNVECCEYNSTVYYRADNFVELK